MKTHRNRFSIFLLSFLALCYSTYVFTDPINVSRREFIDLKVHDSQTVVIFGHVMTRQQQELIKLGLVFNAAPPKIGLFGNHQVWHFGQHAFGNDLPENYFFNYAYANLSIQEVRDYLYYLDSIGKLPTDGIIVHITTPHNDNGWAIIGYQHELPGDVEYFFERSRGASAYWTQLSYHLGALKNQLREHFDWVSLISGLYSVVEGEAMRYQVFNRSTCGDVVDGPIVMAPRYSLFGLVPLPNFVTSIGDLASTFRKYCEGKKSALHSDGHFNPIGAGTPVKNQNLLDDRERHLKQGDDHLIADIMKDIIALGQHRKLKVAFLVTPVYEDDRTSIVDDIFSEALSKVPDAVILDHRNKYRERSFFHGYDHPSYPYFEKVGAELRTIGFLD